MSILTDDAADAMYLVPDVLIPGLAVVFCGSALGDYSWHRRAYYANPGNRFWQTLAEVGLTPCRLTPQEYPSVQRHGIGLTDLVKTEHGQDQAIFDGHVDLDSSRSALRAKIEGCKPGVLAFTSKTVAARFLGRTVHAGRQPECIDKTILWVLPSTSGLARRFFDIEPWRELAALVRQVRGMAGHPATTGPMQGVADSE